MSGPPDDQNCLVVTCGTGPVPIMLTLDTFRPSHVLLIHGPKSGAQVAHRIKNFFGSVAIDLLEVPLDRPDEIRSILGAHAESLVGRTLVYGGGTTPMNVMAYQEWSLANIEHAVEAWYLSANTHQFQSDFGNFKSIDTSQCTLSRIADVHTPDDMTVDVGIDVLSRVPHISDDDLRNLGSIVDVTLKNAGAFSAAFDGTELSEPAAELCQEIFGHKSGNERRGDFFESVLAIYLARLYGQRAGEVRNSVKVNLTRSGSQVFELDVVVRVGQRLVVVSSGLGKDVWKEKALEVFKRASDLGGREVQAMAVVGAVRPQQRENALVDHDRRRFEILTYRQLFGSEAGTALLDPVSSLRQRHKEHIVKWFG